MFSTDVIEAVKRHMNNDHADDALLICRALGKQPTATAVQMTGMDETALQFSATVDGQDVPVHIPWYGPIADRNDIRLQVVRMYLDACTQLGVSPKREEAGEHHG